MSDASDMSDDYPIQNGLQRLVLEPVLTCITIVDRQSTVTLNCNVPVAPAAMLEMVHFTFRAALS